MATVILLRHARSTANGAGVLAGRQPGVALSDRGVAQASELVDRLAGVPVAAVVTSPLDRCRQTLAPLLDRLGLDAAVEPDLAEVDYGQWTGRAIRDLLSEPLWSVVQQHPSAAVFPEGEGLATVQARAVAAIRAHDARVTAEHGPRAVWVACSHGDVIKAVLADALGVHLDGFQRIVVDPASVSVVQYTETRPFVLRVNDNGGDLSVLAPPPEKVEEPPSSDAVVGGTTGA
ncbi:MSMEG_4193 family putative phosphomutase [Saccharothrix sp. 6-C]|uniref:Putative phosphomutase (TIGR03848 family) n=1 Tax=Saccharothrix texasensis TaxID=103734 RepID=A0A3N1GYQ3_9PSEU|nr:MULTISPECIES: histidine phosphatase family protein [Saccharothrix]QQQ79843.1 MSMEG_4193 family putative phosphomutase [Saccharothrix sp. 6-C]ROP35410.1 putative phosphomutase (TIGR03848 family) [Saccharothrix texasensis]